MITIEDVRVWLDEKNVPYEVITMYILLNIIPKRLA